MEKEPFEVVVFINGTSPAFLPNGRQSQWAQGRPCTSISLYIIGNGKVVFHVLVDCGPGVPQAVLDTSRYPDRAPDLLILSHSHGDHFLGFDQLVGSLRRILDKTGQPVAALKVVALKETFEEAIIGHFAFQAKHVEHIGVLPGTTTDLWTDGDTARLSLTMVEVKHFRRSCVGVFEFSCANRMSSRLVTLFDIGDFYPSGSPEWARGSNPDNPLFQRPEILICACNTWNERPTGHISFFQAAQYIYKWAPQQTRLVHYSGFEDMQDYENLMRQGLRIPPHQGPGAEWEFNTAAHRHLHGMGFADPHSVSLAYPGQALVLFPSLPHEELLVAVKRERGRLVAHGPVARSVAHSVGVPHTTAILIPFIAGTGSIPGRILIHRRSAQKRVSPGRLDFAGGHVPYETAMVRGQNPSVLEDAIVATVLREATEELVCEPVRVFTSNDVTRLGDVGEFTTGLDHMGEGNVEFSTVYLVRLPTDKVSVRDTDAAGETALKSSWITLQELCEMFATIPEDFADGAARVLARLLGSPSGELRQAIEDELRSGGPILG